MTRRPYRFVTHHVPGGASLHSGLSAVCTCGACQVDAHDHDDDAAVLAMTPPSSLNIFREQRGQKPIADPMLEAQRRMQFNHAHADVLFREHRADAAAVELADDDPIVQAMTAHSSTKPQRRK